MEGGGEKCEWWWTGLYPMKREGKYQGEQKPSPNTQEI